MKPNSRKPFLFAFAMITLSIPATRAATLTWDTASGDGESITAGSGDWNTTATNWNNAGTNEAWSQTSDTAATHAAVFGGSDGDYTVTLSGTVNAQSVTFNNSGYTLSGGTLILRPTSTTNGGITVAANKTATINSLLQYSSNAAATNVINAGATLNLGGGASNSQYTFNGTGSVNITGGNYEANIGAINVSSFNISGGTYNLTPGASNGYTFGAAVARNVNVNVSSTGTLTLNNTDTNTGAAAPFIAIGNNTNSTTHTTSLTVQSGGTVTIGGNQGARAAEIRISNSGNANGLLDVQGGTVTVGTGNANNKIYLFKNGATAGYSASMTQSGGTVTTNGIQFGGAAGTYEAGSAANLTLSGGSLYIGTAGITRSSAATDLPTTIQLQGGTLGADQNWTSALNMQLGTSGGGVTIRAANAAGTSRTITLSGILSGNGGLVKTGSGTLSLGGANTFEGGISILNGTVNAITNNAALGTGTVTMGGAGSTGASLLTGRTLANPITVNAPDSGSVVIGANGGGSGYTLSGGITLNGDLTIRTFDNIINGSIKAQGTLTGGITGSGNVILDNLGLAANALIFNTGAINHTGSLTLQGSATGDTTINADIGSNVTSVTQNSATSRMVLTGTNTYSGATLVSAGTLLVSGSLISDVTVSDGATLAGGGTVGAITFGGLSFFDMFSPVNSADSLAATTISFGATGFGIGSLRFNGSAVAWSLIDDGTYTLITGTLNSSNLGNFGVANAFDLGDDRIAYFQDGSLQLVVETIPEPRAALLGGLGLFCLLRRRRY